VPVANGSSWTLQQASDVTVAISYSVDSQSNPTKHVDTQVLTSSAQTIETISEVYFQDAYGMSGFQFPIANAFLLGRPSFKSHADGTATVYAYQLNPDSSLTTTNRTGTIGGTGYFENPGGLGNIVDGVEEVRVEDALGRPLSVTSRDILSMRTLTQRVYTYLGANLSDPSYQVVDLAGRTNTYIYDCCTLETATDRDGVETAYGYDLMKRPTSSTVFRGAQPGVTTSWTLDGAGRVLETQRSVTNSLFITLGQTRLLQ